MHTPTSYTALERTAFAESRTRRTHTPNLYVRDGNSVLSSKPSAERLISEALEADPDVYAQYRDQHNAGAILHTLAKAGIKLG